jgi:hypothetical protein
MIRENSESTSLKRRIRIKNGTIKLIGGINRIDMIKKRILFLNGNLYLAKA